jgi:hypothetical protein
MIIEGADVSSMQSKSPMHLKPPIWSADKEREPVPVARNAKRPVSSARRKVAERSQG